MKIFRLSELGSRFLFQGDIALRVVSSEESKGASPEQGHVIAHSETGHHHTAEGASVLGLDPLTAFISPDGSGFMDGIPYVDIVHHRPYDVHETFRLLWDLPNVMVRIRRQRESTPEGWRRVDD